MPRMFDLGRAGGAELASEKGGLIAYGKGVAKFGFPARDRNEGKAFADEETSFCGIKTSRRMLIYVLNCVCFAVHLIFFIVTLSLGVGKADKMRVTLYKMEPTWTDVSANGFNFTAVENGNQFLYLHTSTSLFFFLSALAHSVWVIFGLTEIGDRYLWAYLRDCMGYWRWIEYSLSASLMLACLSVSVAVRDVYILLCIFSLNLTTMVCGFATELFSRPKATKRDPQTDVPTEYDYNFWHGQKDGMSTSFKVSNYAYRMVPHFSGFFPYFIAWWCMLSPLFDQLSRLPSGASIPAWVLAAILGTFFIFTSFTFCQIVYQWRPPRHYWQTEVVYCVLSLVAKSYLGLILLWNVILADTSFDESTGMS